MFVASCHVTMDGRCIPFDACTGVLAVAVAHGVASAIAILFAVEKLVEPDQS